MGPERQYLQLTSKFAAQVERLIFSRLGLTRVDAAWNPDLESELDKMAEALGPGLLGVAKSLDQFSRLEMARVMSIELKADPRLYDASLRFARENVKLIKNASRDQLSKIRAIVSESAIQGVRAEVISRQIQERTGVLASRAGLIARDQVLKHNSDLSRFRAEALGVRRYRWSSSQDERVRDDHAALNGRTFEYDNPPIVDQKTGRRENPGKDYQCRCVAVPETDELLFGEADVEQPQATSTPSVPAVSERPKRELDDQLFPTDTQAPLTMSLSSLAQGARVSKANNVLLGMDEAGRGQFADVVSVRAHEGDLDLVSLDPQHLAVSVIQAAEERKGLGSKLYSAGYDIAKSRGQKLVSDKVETRSAKANSWWDKQVTKGTAEFDERLERFVLNTKPIP